MTYQTKVTLRDGRVVSGRIEAADGLKAIAELARLHDPVHPPISGDAMPVVELHA